MNCIKCDIIIPKESVFCPKCATRVKCKKCEKLLLKDAKVCTSCGKKVKKRKKSKHKKNKGQNSIKFIQNENGVSVDATFTDKIGKNITGIFNGILGSDYDVYTNNSSKELVETTDFEIVEETESKKLLKEGMKKNNSDSKLNDIFKLQDENWILNEPRLKASNATDFGKRLTLLYIALKEENSEDVKRGDLTKVLEKASVNNGGTRSYIANNSHFNKGEKGIITLTLPGKERVKKILEEVYDDNMENVFDISSISKKSKAKLKTLHETIDLGLSEIDRNSLREFYLEKSPKGQNDLVLTIMFWFKVNKNKDNLNLNEIHTGIQIVGEKTPRALVAVMNNLRRKDNKVNKGDNKSYVINNIGVDYIKEKLPYKN